MNLEAIAWYKTLLAIPGVGPATIKHWHSQFTAIDQLFSAPTARLHQLGLPAKIISQLHRATPSDLEHERRWLASSPQHFILTLDDPDYPVLLKQIDDPPALLFGKGAKSLLHQSQLAVVGSRNPSPLGRDLAGSFAGELVRQSMTITSGLAMGIDAQAHQAALRNHGYTVAVVGSGLERIYPKQNIKLAQAIADSGVIISELPLTEPPKAHHFPRRNRIIAGLSLGVLVIEAAAKSGSLITARLAMEQNREVFALPGALNNPLAKGCHRILKQGAHLVESVGEILEHLGYLALAQQQLAVMPTAQPSSAGAAELLAFIDYSPTSLDTLVERTQKAVADLSPKLLTLELDGWIKQTAGGYLRQK